MKTWVVIGTIALAIAVLGAGALAGTVWAQNRWADNMMGAGYGPAGYGATGPGTTNPAAPGYGYGMMGGDWDEDDMPFGPAQDMPCYSGQDMPLGGAYTAPGAGEIASLEQAEAAIHDYIGRVGYTGLELSEIMEFDRNYYAIVVQEDSGIGAMELLVDKSSGAVGPEPGPNMMWNTEYGMMGRGGGMMGGYGSETMTLSPQEAQEAAQRWLDANWPGRTAGEPDPFYGYYTLHFSNDGEIEGMLSVHGDTGDVWYHSWHGDFVTMSEGHE